MRVFFWVFVMLFFVSACSKDTEPLVSPPDQTPIMPEPKQPDSPVGQESVGVAADAETVDEKISNVEADMENLDANELDSSSEELTALENW